MGGQATGRFWAVDAIDGTASFRSGLPFWTISPGLVDQAQPVAGGILVPALGLMAVDEATGARRTARLALGSLAADPPCIASAATRAGLPPTAAPLMPPVRPPALRRCCSVLARCR